MNNRLAEKKHASWSARRIALWSLYATIVFELMTLVSRFGLGLQSTRDTQILASYTFGFRIHHGYLGALLLLLCWLFPAGRARSLVIIVALGLIGSDLIHHFAVLWPLTGSPQFDIRYD